MAKILGIVNLYDSPSLGGLTKNRTTGSTSFLGRYAIMDFALSNFTNSFVDTINVLVKDNFRSVSKHCGTLKTWVNNTKIARQNILINEKGIADPKYNSDINALRENDWILFQSNPDYIVIIPAHIVTTLNIRDFVDFHIKNNADISIAYTAIKDGKVAFLSSSELEIKNNEIVSIKENKGEKNDLNVSLRSYVFSRKTYESILHHEDFRDALSIRMLIEKLVANKSVKICGYKYDGYARCYDSFEHFVEYTFELFNFDVNRKLFKKDVPIYTVTHNSVPALYGENADVTSCCVANGSIIEGTVKRSVVSRNVKIQKGAIVEDCILLTNCVIKSGVKLSHVVVDKYAVIGKSLSGTKEKPLYVDQGAKIE